MQLALNTIAVVAGHEATTPRALAVFSAAFAAKTNTHPDLRGDMHTVRTARAHVHSVPRECRTLTASGEGLDSGEAKITRCSVAPEQISTQVEK